MGLFADVISLFVPPRCSVCGRLLMEGERTFCNGCRATAPMTDYVGEADNPVFRRFWGIVPVERASALIFFVKGSGWQRAVHDFKYRSAWRVAEECGEWLGAELAASGLYADVDVVVPVPLHRLKELRRGYNQSEYIARGVARTMGVALEVGNVVRTKHNPSQALRPYHERWNNVEGIFSLRNAAALEGRHILLVDDVFTTGATISSCAEAILAAVPNVRISVATFATAGDEFSD